MMARAVVRMRAEGQRDSKRSDAGHNAVRFRRVQEVSKRGTEGGAGAMCGGSVGTGEQHDGR